MTHMKDYLLGQGRVIILNWVDNPRLYEPTIFTQAIFSFSQSNSV